MAAGNNPATEVKKDYETAWSQPYASGSIL